MKRDKALDQLMDKCIEAIEHVGVANYIHRESEAKACVRKAFERYAKGQIVEGIVIDQEFDSAE